MTPVTSIEHIVSAGRGRVGVHAIITDTAADALRRTSNRRTMLVEDSLARSVRALAKVQGAGKEARLRITTDGGRTFVDVDPRAGLDDRLEVGNIPEVLRRAETTRPEPLVPADPDSPAEQGDVLLRVEIDERVAADLVEIAEAMGVSLAEAIARGAAVMALVEDVEDDGGQVVVFPAPGAEGFASRVHYRLQL